jgi:RNA polymerase sigma factor (sigma-70 family)
MAVMMPAMNFARQQAHFRTTRWSRVRCAAQRDGDPASARAALGELCVTYWRPLYSWLRQLGHVPDEAAELVQGFVTELLEKQGLVEPEGRFRHYLIGALRHYVSHVRRAAATEKRGGGRILDVESAERRYGELRDPCLSPEAVLDQALALELLERSLARLREEMSRRSAAADFEELLPLIEGADSSQGELTYARVAARFGCSQGALRVRVHRIRRRLGDIIRNQVRELVADDGELESELIALRQALSGTRGRIHSSGPRGAFSQLSR